MRREILMAAALLLGSASLSCCAANAAEATTSAACAANEIEKCIEQCRRNYPRSEDQAQRFACYDTAELAGATRKLAPVAENAPIGLEKSQLDRLWDEPKEDGFKAYRQSYVMYAQTNQPNSAPTSPNPNNRVPYAYNLRQGEAKFQFSLKALVAPRTTLGYDTNLWFAYTQQSYWQILDAAHSRPFRESNYEPEFIFSHRFEDNAPTLGGMHPRFLNLGAVHQSNGQSDPRSRSWNRVYLQLGTAKTLSDGTSHALLIRPWWRLGEPPAEDNNADITTYLGHGDIEYQYWGKRFMFSLLARSRALQADLSLPACLNDCGKQNSLRWHLQLFTGYGESLIDYNQNHSVIGIGLSVPYGDSKSTP